MGTLFARQMGQLMTGSSVVDERLWITQLVKELVKVVARVRKGQDCVSKTRSGSRDRADKGGKIEYLST